MAASSKNGKICVRNTPQTPVLRSIQKYVFPSPAQARLPAARPVGAWAVLIKKLRPYFCGMPGKKSASRERAGATVCIGVTARAPM